MLRKRGNSCGTGVHQRLMDANSSRAGRWQRHSLCLRHVAPPIQIKYRNVGARMLPHHWKMHHRMCHRLNGNPKLPPKFKPVLPLEFLPTEEMPQTPPTKPGSSSNMDVFICGLPAVWLSMTGRPPSHVCCKCSSEGERKKSFPEFILFTAVS